MPAQTIILRHLGAVASAALLAVSIACGLTSPAAAAGPPSVADLSADLIDTVVNISTSHKIAADGDNEGTSPPSKLPPGSPFEDLFDQFFNKKGGNESPLQRRSDALGSGFVIDPSGIIVTNNHVIEEADDIEINFNDGTRLKAKLIGRDKKVDIAVLKVEATKPLKAAKFADSDKVRVGDWALAIGNPFGLSSSVTLGIISARNRDINSGPYDNYLQTDAAINKGNSGGPLFDMDGNVIGVNTAIISPTGGSIGLGFSVPAATVVPIIEQLRQYGQTRRGWIGVKIQSVTDEVAQSLDLGSVRGALVAAVDEKGPAKAAGLEPGDVIVSFNGHKITQMRDLPRIVADTAAGKTVDITIIRKGQTLTRAVTVDRLDEDEALVKSDSGTQTPAPTPDIARKFGLHLSELSGELRQKFNLKSNTRGALVTKVESGSDADNKQIKPGDLIVRADQSKITNVAELTKYLADLQKNGADQVILLISDSKGLSRLVTFQIR